METNIRKRAITASVVWLVGCGAAKPDVPTAAMQTDTTTATESVVAKTPRRRRVFDGETPILDMVDEPGILSSTAAPPPGRYEPPRHPFLTAAALSPMHESKLRDILNASQSFDDFVTRLKAAGFSVRDMPE